MNPFQLLWEYQAAKFWLQVEFWAAFGPWGLLAAVLLWLGATVYLSLSRIRHR
jgi:hypothetical protein